MTVETDMTDIGTGSYTIIAQTAAEMMGVPLDRVVVRLGCGPHLVRARDNGVTQELIETITHLAFYPGWPNAITAITVAKDVFEKR